MGVARKQGSADLPLKIVDSALSRSSWGTPLSSTSRIHGPFRLVNLSEYRAIHNHDGSRPGVF